MVSLSPVTVTAIRPTNFAATVAAGAKPKPRPAPRRRRPARRASPKKPTRRPARRAAPKKKPRAKPEKALKTIAKRNLLGRLALETYDLAKTVFGTRPGSTGFYEAKAKSNSLVGAPNSVATLGDVVVEANRLAKALNKGTATSSFYNPAKRAPSPWEDIAFPNRRGNKKPAKRQPKRRTLTRQNQPGLESVPGLETALDPQPVAQEDPCAQSKAKRREARKKCPARGYRLRCIQSERVPCR